MVRGRPVSQASFLTAILLGLLAACGPPRPAHTDARRTAPPTPPRAAIHAATIRSPHGVRADPYAWLRDDTRQDPRVLGYLRAETAYADAMLAPSDAVREQLFGEMVARLQETDTTVPYPYRGFWYYAKTEAGKQYPIYARRPRSLTEREQVVLDENRAAEGHAFYRLGDLAVSPDGKLLAYLEDTIGRGQFALRVRDLGTGETLPDTAADLGSSVAWAADSATVFYTVNEPTTLRTYRVVRHRLGTPAAADAVVYEEPDEAFSIDVDVTKSEAFVVVASTSTETSDVLLVPTDAPTTAVRRFVARERGHEYAVDHDGEHFYVRSNWQAPNFRLLRVEPGHEADRQTWQPITPAREDAFVDDFAVLGHGNVALTERSGGLLRLRVAVAGQDAFYVDADEPSFAMTLVDELELGSGKLRYGYESLATPYSSYELDLATRERSLLKQEPVRGGYDPARYRVEYLHATAADGTAIPISVVYRGDRPHDGTGPVLVDGYGAYGSSFDPYFSSARISLLDRGFAYAIAHIRGGQELGRRWYDGGRLMNKRNTFTDFIAASEHLIRTGYAAPDRLCGTGASAGGLLIGAVVNMRPDLYRAIIAHVPFVDVVTTMLDASIPLTTFEYDEWGNPADRAAYDYMLSYSPYDNVGPRAYPAMLVTTGLWDSQVQYFEPAKWVAKLRAAKTDDNPLLFQVNMNAGHGGQSGRYRQVRETARDYAFLLQMLALPDTRRAGVADAAGTSSAPRN
jgi:oligopeptidase B